MDSLLRGLKRQTMEFSKEIHLIHKMEATVFKVIKTILTLTTINWLMIIKKNIIWEEIIHILISLTIMWMIKTNKTIISKTMMT
jgi:hypothetical protein